MTVRDEANLIVATCLRNNTSLEDLHAAGKITQGEMRTLMIEVCSNVEWVLRLRAAIPKEKAPLYAALLRHYSMDTSLAWDTTQHTGGLWALGVEPEEMAAVALTDPRAVAAWNAYLREAQQSPE